MNGAVDAMAVVNALVAATHLLIPIQSSYFAALRQDNLGQFLAANPSLTGASAG